MNDPHIEALHYSVRHAGDVDYDKANPLDHDTPGFTVRIENLRAEVRMKSHHATVEAASAEVEPFLRAWELTAALQFRPGDFEFAYDRATIVDRNPTPGAGIYAVGVVEIANATGTWGTRNTPTRRPLASHGMRPWIGCSSAFACTGRAVRHSPMRRISA
jgi:hypothetical protein